MQLRVSATTEVAVPPERAFAVVAANEGAPRMMLRFGPIPGVVAVEMLDGAPLVSGARRRVVMTDGSEIREEVLAYDPPHRHRYRWLHPPAPPFSLLVRSAEGDWIFSATDRGTRIDLTYTFDLTSPLMAGPAWLALRVFKAWMQAGLDRAAAV